jgi:Predicted membrane protein
MGKWKSIKKILLLAAKIAVGSSMAIYIAQKLQLNYAVSAGTITLLTLMTTKLETVKLSAARLVMFVMTVLIAWMIFLYVNIAWCAYGIFIFIIVFLCEIMGWRATLSVSSVTGAHLLTSQDFSDASIQNEFLLVLIGITIALILNLFHDNHSREKDMIAHMRHVESKLQLIIGGLAAYLLNKKEPANVWDEICNLEKEMHEFLKDSYEFQDNTFLSHPAYYIDYFEMRQGQCQLLHNLHYEMRKIRQIPRQAEIIAEYMLYLKDYVVERNEPTEQMDRLNGLLKRMKEEEMPKTRMEFENRALLYHILMDLEDFLIYKARFVEGLDSEQLKKYWN